VVVTGEATVYLSRQIPLMPEMMKMVKGDINEQTHQCLRMQQRCVMNDGKLTLEGNPLSFVNIWYLAKSYLFIIT